MKKMTKDEILQYAGDPEQIFGLRDFTYNSGRAKGVRGIDVDNGAGMRFTVLPDRAMDIASLSYKGINLSYLSKSGITNAQYFECGGTESLRNFYGGFMTTCGMRQTGSPCEDGGETLCQHGRLNNCPAEDVSAQVLYDENDIPYMRLSGWMREAKLMGESLRLSREILCRFAENRIEINDVIENYGFDAQPLMLLYHLNYGFPLLSGQTYAVIPSRLSEPADEMGRREPSGYDRFTEPQKGYIEHGYIHRMQEDAAGGTFYAVINRQLNIGVAVEFSARETDYLLEWKMIGAGDYVLGLEPAVSWPDGRASARSRSDLRTIGPRGKHCVHLSARVLDGEQEIGTYLDEKGRLGFRF
jgi:hypothetical protein